MLWIWYFLFYTLWGYLNKLHCHNKLFVVNLVCFLNFNMNTSARLGIFLPKWLILRKIYFFCLLSCYYWYSNLSGMEYILAEKHSENISALISHHSIPHEWSHLLLYTKLSMKTLHGLLKELPHFSLVWNMSS